MKLIERLKAIWRSPKNLDRVVAILDVAMQDKERRFKEYVEAIDKKLDIAVAELRDAISSIQNTPSGEDRIKALDQALEEAKEAMYAKFEAVHNRMDFLTLTDDKDRRQKCLEYVVNGVSGKAEGDIMRQAKMFESFIKGEE